MFEASRLWPGGPSIAGDAWARRWLTPKERELWEAMPARDRRLAVERARRTATALGSRDGTGVPTNALAAALLEDAGMAEARLGTLELAATMAALKIIGRDRVGHWAATGRGWRRRAGHYAHHDSLGAGLLRAADSDPFVVAWAADHHKPQSQWSADTRLGAVLRAAGKGRT